MKPNLSDQDLVYYERLLIEEMYHQSEQNLYKFFVNFWNTFDPQKLVNNWHLECLCEHIQAAYERQIRRLIVNIPPRSSKSTTASICGPAWWLINHPNEKFWLISHSERLFIQNIVYIRRILSHPKYKNRWLTPTDNNPWYQLSGDVNTKTRMETTSGGYILGGSPGGEALGMGYSIAILDDILGSNDSDSLRNIDAVNEWYTSTFMNRSNDINTDVVILVMQRLHANDITNYVLETYPEDNWFVLNLPARYEPTQTFYSPIGFNDKRTKKNQLLDPIRLSDEFLERQSKNPIIYNTRYQQNPEATNLANMLDHTWIKTCYELWNPIEQYITVWDLSFSDSPTSSYTVGLLMGIDHEKNYYILDMWRKQAPIPDQINAIQYMSKKYAKSLVAVETEANGPASIALLQKDIPNIIPLNPKNYGGNKIQRFSNILNVINRGNLYIYQPKDLVKQALLENTFDEAIIRRELTSFPIGKTNDIVDCFVYATRYLHENKGESMAIITGGKPIVTKWDTDPYENKEDDPYLIFGDIPNRTDLDDVCSMF